MPMLDVFNSDAFSVVSLTQALDKIPFAPSFLGSMGLFQEQGITTKYAVVEERHGRLSLVTTSARGTVRETENREDRKARSFLVPHLATTEAVLAEDVQDVRAFGQENAVETLSELITRRNMAMRANLEVTKEWHRIGAIQGSILDGDASSIIYDLFDEFGIIEETEDFEFTDDEFNTKQACTNVIRKTENALGGTMFSGVVGIAGNDWWDAMIGHKTIETAFNRWLDGELFRTSQRGGAGGFTGPGGQVGFTYSGITFFNYRGSVGDVKFIADDVCRFFPVGANGIFITRHAPADYIETVNTVGLPYYVKMERMKFDKGMELETQTNPLIICTRPKVLIKGTQS
jgi:hypothetical protein